MRLPRRFLRGQVYFISARAALGLPFPAVKLVNRIIRGIVAKAQYLYPVPICHYQFMGNHFHLVVVCSQPQAMSSFYKHLKAELARSINKLTGKRGVLWQGRCDAVPLLTAEDVLYQTAYLYSNPQSAHLVERIEQWPGVCSWRAFATHQYEERCEWIPVRQIVKGGIKDTEEYKEYTLKIRPSAWLKSKEYREIGRKEAKLEIIRRVRARELELCKERREKAIGVVGRKMLEGQELNRAYRPKKYGRRVCCICHDIELRRKYIEEFKEYVKLCREVYRSWSRRNFSISYPPGAFPAPLLVLVR